MRTYPCLCGNLLFYDNSHCLACNREVGYCPACQNLVALLTDNNGAITCGNPECGAALVKCANYVEHQVCNRCIALPVTEPAGLCDCCRFNQTIPDLTVPGNLQKWYRLESAKRRLFYDLNLLGLPYGTTADGIKPELSFDFKADVIPKANLWRNLAATERVYTGHANGNITINLREADEVEREKLRVDLGESKRTLIGHFRHEVGHFYWDVLVKGRREEECIQVFGDHNNPTYSDALERYYKEGPLADWDQSYISAYSTMHPWEDFAETWAVYLSMVGALDTAWHMGLGSTFDPQTCNLEGMIKRYQQVGVALNEMNRSMGLLDLVPEIIVPPVVVKLQFIHDLVAQGRAENGAIHPELPAAAPPVAQPVAEPAQVQAPVVQPQVAVQSQVQSAQPPAPAPVLK
jgi:hypothetical protein